jgi:hypothetical protein
MTILPSDAFKIYAGVNLLNTFSGSDRIEDVAIAGDKMAYGDDGSEEIKIYKSGGENPILQGFASGGSGVTAMDMSESYIAHGGYEQAWIYKMSDGSVVYNPQSADFYNVEGIALNDEFFAYGGGASDVWIDRLSDGTNETTITPSANGVNDVDLSRSHIGYVTGDDDSCYIHEISTGNEIYSASGTASTNGVAVTDDYFAFTYDDHCAVHSMSDGLEIYNLSPGNSFNYRVDIFEEFLIFASDTQSVYLHDLQTGELINTFSEPSSRALSAAIGRMGLAYGDTNGNSWWRSNTVGF